MSAKLIVYAPTIRAGAGSATTVSRSGSRTARPTSGSSWPLPGERTPRTWISPIPDIVAYWQPQPRRLLDLIDSMYPPTCTKGIRGGPTGLLRRSLLSAVRLNVRTA
ncbi:hypothetical protein [Streptomyces virginiae]|uniref:hypothetical protein n=1 Tax=Streptomyces virginiae TaxID=1961 RepID=UPI0035D6DBCA